MLIITVSERKPETSQPQTSRQTNVHHYKKKKRRKKEKSFFFKLKERERETMEKEQKKLMFRKTANHTAQNGKN